MEKTLYQKLIDRELPVWPVYEDDIAFAFLDLIPSAKGHTLVVPKEPYRNILSMPTETLAHLMSVVQKVSQTMMDTLNADGVTIVMNNEPAGGQEVFHAHIHVIPRFENDEIFEKPKHTEYVEEEKEEIREKLFNALN